MHALHTISTELIDLRRTKSICRTFLQLFLVNSWINTHRAHEKRIALHSYRNTNSTACVGNIYLTRSKGESKLNQHYRPALQGKLKTHSSSQLQLVKHIASWVFSLLQSQTFLLKEENSHLRLTSHDAHQCARVVIHRLIYRMIFCTFGLSN